MSEATVKALTDAIYDAYQDSGLLNELDNEQIYAAARLAAQTIESAGTTKAIVRAWLESIRLTDGDIGWWAELSNVGSTQRAKIHRWVDGIRAVQS